jgi:UDP-2,3-diacylglucosamine pyrophosphatase LpxH
MMNLSPAEFDEVHVISDLHLGGRPGFQIFGSTPELVWLIGDLRQWPARRIALVINGDFIDFLAQAPALPFDPAGALDKLAAIANEPAFKPVFDALCAFTATDNRQLIVNLGNHDLEFALPWMREALIKILSGGIPAARGRITLALDGAGVLMRVGGARVLCVHGNEVDRWNVADYEQIRCIGRDIMRGRSAEPWVPNGGSQLVSEVMNPLKHDYPFIDLLKPEVPAVFPMLIALRPSVVTQLRRLAAAVARSSWDAALTAMGLLEEVQSQTGMVAAAPARATVGRVRLGAVREARKEVMARDLFDSTEISWREKAEPLDLVGGDQHAEYLGVIRAAWDLVTGKGPIEALREALDGLDKDRSFDPRTEDDDTYRKLDKSVGGDVDFLIAGHTHLERALKRGSGRGFYFNSGTWARLIQIPPELRQDPAAFANLFQRLKAGTMEALDGGAAEQPLTLRRCSVVSIWHDTAATIGELRHVTGTAPAFTAVPVPGTQFSIP